MLPPTPAVTGDIPRDPVPAGDAVETLPLKLQRGHLRENWVVYFVEFCEKNGLFTFERCSYFFDDFGEG